MPEKKPAAKKAAAKKPVEKKPAKAKDAAAKPAAPKAKGKPCPLVIVAGATFDDVLLEMARFPARSAHELGSLARFEAVARHAERSATLCRQALASTESLRPWAIAASVSPAIVELAQAPAGLEPLLAALIDEAFALVKTGAPDETHYDLEQRISVWLELALAAEAAGNRARAKELLDGAMTALTPSLDRLDSRVIARAAGALLAVGDLARAKDVLTRRSHDLRTPLEARAVRGDVDGVRVLLEVCSDFDCRSAAEQAGARGHAAIVELLAPRLEKADPLSLGVARASLAAHDPSTWARRFDEAFSVSPQQGGMFGSIILDAVARRAPEKLPALLDALAPALEKAPFVDFIPWWRCVGALAAGGRDVGKAIEQGAKHPAALLEALSHGAAHHAAVAELAKQVRSSAEGELAKVAAALLRAGHAEASQEFLEKALEAAGSDRFKCVNVATELAAAGSAEGVWSALKQVSKARRINALEDLIAAQAQRAQFGVVLGLLRTEPSLTWNAVYQAGFGGAYFLARA